MPVGLEGAVCVRNGQISGVCCQLPEGKRTSPHELFGRSDSKFYSPNEFQKQKKVYKHLLYQVAVRAFKNVQQSITALPLVSRLLHTLGGKSKE